jgi:IS5 family transposase
MNLATLTRSPRAMKAITGLSYEEFTNLVPLFKHAYIAHKMANPLRKRSVGGGIKGKLPTYEAKLLFVLFYAKNYPTFDVLGFFFDKPRGQSCEDIHLFLKVLEKALGHAVVLPERKLTSAEEFLEKFPEVKDVFLDGGERRRERPGKPKSERRMYSGKKKAHTRKNVVVADERKRILIITPTKAGRRHDKAVADKSTLLTRIPKHIGVFTDSGFQGIQHLHPNTVVTKRGRKNAPLSEEDRLNNHIIASLRIVVEHAIGGMKRFRILVDRLRMKMGLDEDRLARVCAGLWNWHILNTA